MHEKSNFRYPKKYQYPKTQNLTLYEQIAIAEYSIQIEVIFQSILVIYCYNETVCEATKMLFCITFNL
jgi:hypothetical protein